MNNIITLPLLAELFSEASSCDRAEAEQFLLSFTDLIADGLASDGHVRIKGLGVFKRSMLKDKVRIEFVPDRDFSDFINAPFAFFEPVDLDDSVSADMLEGVEVSNRIPAESPRDEIIKQDTQPVTETIQPVTEDIPQDEPTDVDTPQEEPAVEATPQEVPAVEETPQEEPAVEEAPQEEPAVEETPQEEPAVEETPQEEPAVEETPQEEPAVEETPQDEPAVEEAPQEEPAVDETPQEEPVVDDTPQEEPVVDDTPQEEPVVEDTPKAEAVAEHTPEVEAVASKEPESEEDAEYDEYDEAEDEKPRTTFWFWLAVMFIFGVLAGMVLLYFCQDTFFPSHAVTTEVPASNSQTEPEPLLNQDTPLVEEMPDSPADTGSSDITDREPATSETTVNNEPIVEQQQEPAPATTQQPPVYDKVTQNRTLTKMAKEHYGNKDYWVYIYMENTDVLKNPNNIKIGTELRIPPKSKYDVSTDENENIAAAKEKARELFNKYGN